MARIATFAFVIGLALTAMLGAAQAERRAALVIGINDYDSVTDLEKAVGDARAMAATLRGLGFQVTALENTTRRDLNQAISTFATTLSQGDTAFVHFSGHGVEIDGENYLLPADIPTPESGQRNFVKSEAIAMSELIGRIGEAGARTRVFVIDACRDNPFEHDGVRGVGGTRGLARVEAPAGTFIMYSAGYRQQALDRLGADDTEDTSVYTRTLIQHLTTPGRAIDDIAQDVRREVEQMARSIGHEQRPAYYDELSARLVLVNSADGEAPPAVRPPPPPAAPGASAAAEAWAATENTDNIAILEAFIRRFEGTYYADIAQIRIDELRSQEAEAPAADAAGAGEQEVASVPDTGVPPGEPALDPRELARAVQIELDRLGCDPGRPDGIWGNRSRGAVELFNQHAPTRLASTDPSAEGLDLLRNTPARVCPQRAAPPPPSAAPDTTTAALSGCVRVNVRATPLDGNNEKWDPFPGSTEAPDITVYDASSRARLFACTDSYSCAGTLTASGGSVNLLINDDDYDAPDPMGQGQCSLSRSDCTLGLARLRFSPC